MSLTPAFFVFTRKWVYIYEVTKIRPVNTNVGATFSVTQILCRNISKHQPSNTTRLLFV